MSASTSWTWTFLTYLHMLATEPRKQANNLFNMSASTNLRTGTITSYRRATEPAVCGLENIIPTSKDIY